MCGTGEHAASNATFALAVQRGVWSHPQQRPSHHVRGLRARPWWSVDDVPLARRLTTPAALAVLRSEARALLAATEVGAASPPPPSSSSSSSSSSDFGPGFQPYRSPALTAGNWSDVTLMLSGARQPGWRRAPRSYELYASLGEQARTMMAGWGPTHTKPMLTNSAIP